MNKTTRLRCATRAARAWAWPRWLRSGQACPLARAKSAASVATETPAVAILAFGTLLYPALQAAEALDATVVNMRWAKPLG